MARRLAAIFSLRHLGNHAAADAIANQIILLERAQFIDEAGGFEFDKQLFIGQSAVGQSDQFIGGQDTVIVEVGVVRLMECGGVFCGGGMLACCGDSLSCDMAVLLAGIQSWGSAPMR